MQADTFRTTIDLNGDIARKLKEYSAHHGLSQKKIITKALQSYLSYEATEKDAEVLWKELRKLAKKGRKKIDFTYELRKDRNR